MVTSDIRSGGWCSLWPLLSERRPGEENVFATSTMSRAAIMHGAGTSVWHAVESSKDVVWPSNPI